MKKGSFYVSIISVSRLFLKGAWALGKDLKGKELGVGLSQRKDGRYSARFVSRTGKRIEKYFNKLQEARRWLAEAKYSEEYQGISAVESRINLDKWYNCWIADKEKTVRYNTLRHYKMMYESNIKEKLGNMALCNIKPIHCQKVLNDMADDGYSAGTITQTRITLHALFDYAVENDILQKNPVTKAVKCPQDTVKKEKRKILSLEEQELFFAACTQSSHRDELMFALQTGMRVGEIQGLKWQDIDFNNKIINVNRTLNYISGEKRFCFGDTKSFTSKRQIPMTNEAYKILKRRKKVSQEQKVCNIEFVDLVFLNSKGNPTMKSAYNTFIAGIAQKAGIEKFSMHTFRHTFATRCIENGIDAKVIQELLGHRTISTTLNLYVHVNNDLKINAIKSIEKYLMA